MKRHTAKTALRLAGAAAPMLLCVAAAHARQGRAAQCNAPMKEPVSFVPLPGHPFSTISSPDGCWLFVSVISSHPRSFNGVAVLKRRGGEITLDKVFPVEAEPTGMTLTHDGKLLVVSDGDYVVFMDAARMTGGGGDPLLG